MWEGVLVRETDGRPPSGGKQREACRSGGQADPKGPSLLMWASALGSLWIEKNQGIKYYGLLYGLISLVEDSIAMS